MSETRSSETVVFLGPTLAAERASAALEGAELRPPARAGDVLRALRDGARRIAIIDGYFDRVPSVWHKEILFALERGALVYGASSMGALRAAELHSFGMIGVGRIFEMYRDGELCDDDEVTIIHGPADSGYRALSEAMVNVRHRLAEAVAASVLAASAAAQIIGAVKALPYRARSYGRLLALAADSPQLEGDTLERLRAFVETPHDSLKTLDALALLERMAAGEDDAPRSERPRVERTVFLERLRLEVAREARPQASASSSDGDDDDDAPPADERALLELLARQHADLLALRPDEHALEQAAHELGLPPEHPRVRERSFVLHLRRLYGPEIDQRVRRTKTSTSSKLPSAK
ncbi:MAG: hypothetical protein KC503_02060 [Myxococcales bacterium]|nr:hypothetical protein [Myxococcales bacterium]